MDNCIKHICLSVGYVWLRAYLRNHHTFKLYQFYVHVACGRGSVLLCRCCNCYVIPELLMMLCLPVIGEERPCR